MKEVKKNWVIGVCNTDDNGVRFYFVYGTKFQVKKYMLFLAGFDIEENQEKYDFGTEKIKEVVEENDGSLYAYGCYSTFHIEYSAKPVTDFTPLP